MPSYEVHLLVRLDATDEDDALLKVRTYDFNPIQEVLSISSAADLKSLDGTPV